jgi:hypothetical protein
VVCSSAGADTAAAVARVASRLRNRQPQARKDSKVAAAAGHSDNDISIEDSDIADASQSDSQGSDSSAGLDIEKHPAGLLALDLKGTNVLAADSKLAMLFKLVPYHIGTIGDHRAGFPL